jgi:gamma-glutamyltranspeptidase / glutathione hydrolase
MKFSRLALFQSLVTVAFVLSCAHQPKPNSTQTSPAAQFPERRKELYDSTGTKFMIASQGEATTLAARKMFALGGNVIDAAAAASFTIAVERPQSTGIAGGGFMVVHLPASKATVAFDFRERAPAKAFEKMYQDEKGEVVSGRSTDGALAVGVPGMVAGVLEIHKKYGKLPLKTVLAPAIELAENGFAVYPHLATALAAKQEVLWKSEAARSIFFHAEKKPLALGDQLKQVDLAKTLRTIADKGRAGFYSGWVGQAIVAEEKKLKGLLTLKDLASYQVKTRKPVRDDFGRYEIVSMPPPSSGGVHVIEILNVLEGLPLEKTGPYSSESVHSTASAMQFAYSDRAKYMGDPDFVSVPLKTLTSDAYAKNLQGTIDPKKAKKYTEVQAPDAKKFESKETTHFTIADSDGNVVTSTQTINGWFGSGVVVSGTGMVLNNEMDDFSAKPGVANKFGLVGGKENAIAPGKRPLSSMSPTIVLKDGKPVLALGSPSGSQIITCVALTALNYLTYKMPLYESVTALRYHHQWTPDQLIVEAPGFSPELTEQLRGMGYDVVNSDIGCKIQAVAFEDGKLHGVSDPRGEGLAVGEGTVPPLQGKYSPGAHVSQD